MKLRIVHKRKIKEIRKLQRDVCVSGVGRNAVMAAEFLGYAALLEPGFDMYFLGETNPGFRPGQSVNLVLEGTIRDADTDSTRQNQPDKDPTNRGLGDKQNGSAGEPSESRV